MVGEQFDQNRGAERPQESPFTDAVRERYQPKDGQDPRPEMRLDQLNPSQYALVDNIVRELKTCFATVDDGLSAVERQRAQTPDFQKESFEEWYNGFRQKTLADLRRNIAEIGDKMPFRLAVDVQCFGPAGSFQPETFKATIPANPEDVTLQGPNAAFKVHSDNPLRDKDLSNDDGPDKYVSGWELAYRMAYWRSRQQSA
ncbi:MAG: hypothetical protein K2W95_27935 [Candidatus Obscuribacterales bacterium]|nr:hypothetical protein [Candidatus Obscuribacterales bacterium]